MILFLSGLKKQRLASYWIQVWLGVLLTNLAFAAPPSHIIATYDVAKSGMQVAQLEENYTRNSDGSYQLVSTARPVGMLAMFKPEKIIIRSSGRITQQGLQPLTFDYEREKDPARSSRAEFNWENGEVALIRQATRNVVALPDGTQDRLSAMYQFIFLNLKHQSTLDFSLTNGNSLSQQHYAIAAGDMITTPAGKFKTLYLDNQSKAGESRTEIWLATQQHQLPCKMRITDANGDELIQVLSKLVIEP
ncbi:MAG: DUF3108 domain-containing protein [Gallionella sp.]|nr:DUF3108 domain-containing protein [Gallionella sp.]MDD4957994.1 DUF3108 domain-containing protein [Gallionella sp.]